jgi:hypothetical protein
MERISGPYKGYFIAAYTVQAGPTSFVGYAKVCVHEPESVWTTNSEEKLTSASGQSELEAVLAAEKKARQAIAEISPGWDTTSLPGALN